MKKLISDPATAKAIAKIDAAAFAVHAGATALAMAGKTDEAKKWILGGLAKLKGACEHLEATA